MLKQLSSNDPRVLIGFGTYASSPPTLRAHHENNKILIGKYCSFAHNVTIFSGGNHPINFVTTHPLRIFLKVENYHYHDWSNDCGDSFDVTEICNDVWIGEGAIILSGVRVGSGSIIGSKAVVTSNVPPYAVVAGNPAKIIKYRFSKETIDKLLDISWWDWNLDKIKSSIDDLCSNNVNYFIKKNMKKMISYAQNFEDVVLWRALNKVKNGFYIDVGANYPVHGSITKHFYEKGWSGINIEPQLLLFEMLQQDRTRDINLNVAISTQPNEIELHMGKDLGWSTTNTSSFVNSRDSFVEESIFVPTLTLDQIWTLYNPKDVHFLKIDVEGAEHDVLKTINLKINRPWIIIIEATLPRTTIDISYQWEDIILGNDYIFSYFDGLNKFYVASEHKNLINLINLPPNIFDDFESFSTQTYQKRATEAEQRATEAEQRATEAEQRATEAEQRAAETNKKLQDAYKQYVSIINSKSWKITKPLRIFKSIISSCVGKAI